MPYLTREYEFRREDTPSYAKKFYQGFQIIENHPIFSELEGRISDNQNQLHNKQSAALVRRTGYAWFRAPHCI